VNCPVEAPTSIIAIGLFFGSALINASGTSNFVTGIFTSPATASFTDLFNPNGRKRFIDGIGTA
jgi:hypothetical protein